MPHRDKCLDKKRKAVLVEVEKQFPNLHFEVYSDAFLVLRPQPKLCLRFDLGWLDAGVETLTREIAKDTQLRH